MYNKNTNIGKMFTRKKCLVVQMSSYANTMQDKCIKNNVIWGGEYLEGQMSCKTNVI